MRSYVDEHVQVIGKRFWERLKKKDFRVAFYKVPFCKYGRLSSQIHINCLLAKKAFFRVCTRRNIKK